MLLSSFLNSNIDYNDGAPIGGGDWAYVLYLPTETATAWYHHAIPNAPSLGPLIAEVENFALAEYVNALAQGAALPADRYNDVVAKLHRYTGLSEQYIRNSDLRIPYDRFENELLVSRGITVGRIDSRFETYVLDRPEVSPDWDATDAAIDSAFTSSSNYYLRQVPGYNTPLTYRANIYDLIYADGQSWDFKHGENVQVLNVTPDLAQAMTYNPRLRLFSANGYFDFATPFFATVYALDHLYLAPAIRRNITFGFYESGHMVYLQPARSRASTPISNAGMRRRSPMFSIATLLAAAVAAAPAAALPPAGTPDAVTSHTIALGGKTYAYTARAGTIPLQNDKNQTTANIFYTAFTVNGADPRTRPHLLF